MKIQTPMIIAEIAQGYEGSEKLVELYVRAVADSGADAIKFQIFYADELALPDYRYYDLFKGLELPFTVWGKAVVEAHKNNFEFYSDLFGMKSFKKMKNIGVDGYKIHSTDINNMLLLEEVAKARKKVFLSTGGSKFDEIDRAVDILSNCDLTLMHGFQSEPTLLGDNNLNKIKMLRERYKRPVGFQDHSKGNENSSGYLPYIAVGLGAAVIEKHFTLSRIAKLEDYISALTAEEFSKWAGDIKKIYSCFGVDEWILTEKEMEYKSKVRRAVCSIRTIKKGQKISDKDIMLKRTDCTQASFNIEEVINKIARNTIPAHSAVRKEDIV